MLSIETYLKQTFNMTDKEIKKITNRAFVKNVRLIKVKTAFLKHTFKLSNQELGKMILKFPPLIATDAKSDEPTSIKSKIKFYEKLFDITPHQTLCLLRKNPVLLGMDTINETETSVKGKTHFYATLFNRTEKEIGKMFASNPIMLGLDTTSNKPTSVKSKIEFYMEVLHKPANEIIDMFAANPQVLHYDIASNKQTAVRSKIKKFSDLGFSSDFIIENPLILTYPAQQVKIRYMLFQLNGASRSQLGSYLMASEDLVYARRQHLLNTARPTNRYPYYSAARFEEHCHITNKEVLETYPLTREKALEIQDDYNFFYPEEKFELTNEELSLYPAESASQTLYI